MATHMVRKILCQGCRKNFRRCGRHSFCSATGAETGSNAIVNTPLSKPLPNLPAPIYATRDNIQHETKITTLENGLRVATEKKFGQSCTLGVLISSGSRFEVNYTSGINHFLEKLAYQKTSEYESRAQVSQALEKAGGILDCQSTRDVMIYASSVDVTGLPTAMNILSDSVYRPIIEDEAVEQVKQTINFEMESHRMNPMPDVLITELIFAAAYRNNTLGLPKLCPEENLNKIDKRMLYTYLSSFYDPKRMVIAAVNADHDVLVDLAKKYFVEKKPLWVEDPSLVDRNKGTDNSIAQYTGGIVTNEVDLSELQKLAPTGMPELAHVVVGLESCSFHDEDFVPFCVLNMLLGGGGSFSAGGPGKGMYSRLYLNVLNRHHWIENATAFNQVFEDAGLFYIYGSSHPSKLTDLCQVIGEELVNTAGTMKSVELDRAKVQLQSMLMMNLEQRPAEFEDIGRQVLSSSKRHRPEYYYDAIGAVTKEDMKRIADRMLSSKPSVAAYGSLARMPTLDTIQKVLRGENTKKKAFSIFGKMS